MVLADRSILVSAQLSARNLVSNVLLLISIVAMPLLSLAMKFLLQRAVHTLAEAVKNESVEIYPKHTNKLITKKTKQKSRNARDVQSKK